jgi:hypothetical protein
MHRSFSLRKHVGMTLKDKKVLVDGHGGEADAAYLADMTARSTARRIGPTTDLVLDM